MLPWTAPALRAWLGLLRTWQNWVWPPQGSVRGRRRTQPRLSPCSGGTAVSMLHCPSNRFENALALLSSIPSRPKLSLAPWGRTTLVQSPVPHVPGHRGHARASLYVHPAPGVDVQHLGVHPEPGAGPGRLQWEQGGEEGRREGIRLRHSLSASAPCFTRMHRPPAPPSELLAPDSRKATTISIKQSHRILFPRSLCEKMHLKGPSAGEMLPPRSEDEGRGRRSLLREQRCRQGVIKHTLMNFPAGIAVMNPRNVLPSPASLPLRHRSERTTPARR